MTGRVAVIGLLAVAALFGAVLWYFQTRAFYEELAPETASAEIRLTPLGGRPPEPILADNIRAIDAATSPIRFRACFSTPSSLAMLTETYVMEADPTPLKAPGWFDCFDYAQLTEDLADGTALAFLGQASVAAGVDRIVAVYPDGRGFAWHQLTTEFTD